MRFIKIKTSVMHKMSPLNDIVHVNTDQIVSVEDYGNYVGGIKSVVKTTSEYYCTPHTSVEIIKMIAQAK